jgi:hypothetical protein
MPQRPQEISLIKTPHRKSEYSDQQIAEFAACADPDSGPMYFMEHFFYIQHPTRGRMKYKPFEYQRRLIDNYHRYRFTISMMPRQTGKSTSAAGYLLWYAMFVPDSTILVAAHKYTGSQEIMQRIRYAYESVPDHIRAGAVDYNKGSLTFDNGSRIVSATTTENTGRGMSISLLYADEFAFVRPTIAVEFWTSISPTLATGGKAIITSTPNSDEDQFAMLWKGANRCVDEYGNPTEVGQNGFRAFRSFWNEHPDRDETWAQQQRAALGVDRFRREMDCEFVTADETLIAPAKLMDLESRPVLYKTGEVRWYQHPLRDRIYCVALDPSLGTGSDPAAIEVFEANTCTQIAEWRHNRTDIPTQIRTMQAIISHINETVKDAKNIYYTVENNSIGEAALISIAELGEENIQGYFLSEPGSGKGRMRKGFNTTNKPKLAACAKLKHLVEGARMTINSAPLVSELKNFVASGAGYAAKPGETDDLVMATLLVVRMLQVLQSYHSDLDNRMRDHGDKMIEPLPFVMIMNS